MDFLNHVFLDNAIRDYALVGAIIFLAYILKKLVGKYFTRLLFFLFRQAGMDVDSKVFTTLALRPAEDFLFFLIAYTALSELHFPEVMRHSFLSTDTQALVHAIGKGIIILAFFRMLLRSIDYIAMEMEKKADMTSDLSDNQLVVFFRDFLKVLLIIIGGLALLRFVFGQDITKILAGLSLVGAAVALAARESLENLIASFIIFFDKPFTTGDLLKVNNITGTVERIGLRSTRIRTPEKTYVSVPNKQMVDSVVDNLSRRTQRRAELRLEIDLATGSAQLNALLAGLHRILERPPVMQHAVLMSDITPSAYLIVLEYFTDNIPIEAFNALKQEINLAVTAQLEVLEIGLAGARKEVIRVQQIQP